MSAQLVGQRGAGADREYIYGREAVATVVGSGTNFFTTDEVGSVVAVRDNDGDLQKAYTYEPFGAVKNSTGSGTGSPLQFAGGLTLAAGVYRLGVRHYDAGTASFTTPDPAGTGETYSYASGNPAVLGDPTGLFSISNPLQDISRLLGNAYTRAGDALARNSVVQSARRGFRYASGTINSRALKSIDPVVAIDVAIVALTVSHSTRRGSLH